MLLSNIQKSTKFFFGMGLAGFGIILLPTAVLAYSPPIGIPDPSWGSVHPIDTPAPSWPSGWPSSEVPNYYYTDNTHGSCTDSSNVYGYPDKPRCTISETTKGSGTYMEIHGGPYPDNYIYLRFNCTEAEPCWVTGTNDPPVLSTPGRFVVQNSKYLIIENIEWANKVGLDSAIAIANYGESTTSHHVAVRGCDFHDWTDVFGDGAVMSVLTRDNGDVHDIVMYNNTFTNISNPAGSCDTNSDHDFHATTIGKRSGLPDTSVAYNIFWLNNTVNVGIASGIQVNAWVGGNDLIHHIYIGDNYGTGLRQRFIGIKQSSHVIVSQNDSLPGMNCVGAGYVQESLGWALSPDYVWYLFNDVHDGADGWRASDSSGGDSTNTHIFIIGNKIYDLKPNEFMTPIAPDNQWRSGQGIRVTNGGHTVHVVDNTFYNVYGGILAPAGDTCFHVYGNVFSSIYPNDAFVSFDVNNVGPVGLDYNLYYDAEGDQLWRSKSGDHTTLGSWTTGSGDDVNSIVGDPKFVDSAQYNFNLQATSPAKDSNTSTRYVYELFQTLYGIDIRVDHNGVPRPQGTEWDMGAYEYVETKSEGTNLPVIQGGVMVR